MNLVDKLVNDGWLKQHTVFEPDSTDIHSRWQIMPSPPDMIVTLEKYYNDILYRITINQSTTNADIVKLTETKLECSLSIMDFSSNAEIPKPAPIFYMKTKHIFSGKFNDENYEHILNAIIP